MAALMLCTAANALTLTWGEGMESEILEKDTTIEVTDYEFNPATGCEMEAVGRVISTNPLVVNITRSAAGLSDELCVDQCVAGNKELTQTISYAAGNNSWYAHFRPTAYGSYEYQYEFVDGEESLTLTVVYVYAATGIENTTAVAKKAGVYTLLGQQVRRDNSTEGLTPGIYIVNGKKTVVK